MTSATRKRRFPVEWPLQYRRRDAADWVQGRTVNMSLSGVLFEGPETLSSDEAVELSIVFQDVQEGGPTAGSGAVRATGYVVRAEPRIPARMAVRFAHAS